MIEQYMFLMFDSEIKTDFGNEKEKKLCDSQKPNEFGGQNITNTCYTNYVTFSDKYLDRHCWFSPRSYFVTM